MIQDLCGLRSVVIFSGFLTAAPVCLVCHVKIGYDSGKLNEITEFKQELLIKLPLFSQRSVSVSLQCIN